MFTRLTVSALALGLALGLAPVAKAQESYESSQILARSAEAAQAPDLPATSPGYSAKMRLRLNGEWSEGTLHVAPGKRRFEVNDQVTIVDVAAGTVHVMSGENPTTAVELPLSSFPMLPDAGDLSGFAPEEVTWQLDEDFGANSGAFLDRRERQFEIVEVIGAMPSGNSIYGILSVSDDGVIDMFHGTIQNPSGLHRVTRLLGSIRIGVPDDTAFTLPEGIEVVKPELP